MSGLMSRQRFWSPVTTSAVPTQRRGGPVPVRGLRRRRPKDVAACARLLLVVHYESHYPLVWPTAPRRWLRGADVLDAWVVERQDEILGHVAIGRVGDDAVSTYRWREITGREPSELAALTRLFVRPRARRQGIGTALLDTAVAEVRDREMLPVLQVVDCNQDAIRLCETLGWRLLSMDPWGPRTERRRVHCYAAPSGG